MGLMPRPADWSMVARTADISCPSGQQRLVGRWRGGLNAKRRVWRLVISKRILLTGRGDMEFTAPARSTQQASYSKADSVRRAASAVVAVCVCCGASRQRLIRVRVPPASIQRHVRRRKPPEVNQGLAVAEVARFARYICTSAIPLDDLPARPAQFQHGTICTVSIGGNAAKAG